MKTSIILAAGKATRFSGTIKELLPISDTESVIDNSINASRHWGADRVIIISNPDKIGYHIRHFEQDKYKDLNIVYKINSAGEMWQSLCNGLEDATEKNLMLMADTIFDYSNLEYAPDVDLSFGIFETLSPERYSVIYDGQIRTKDESLLFETLYAPLVAWGCVLFSEHVVQNWQINEYNHYDEAFNDAISLYGVHTFDIGTYHDLGTFGSYVEYLNKHYV